MADLDDSLLTVSAVEEGTPQAIVILFGWLGSQSRHVKKYAQLYQQRKCSTIYGTADVASIAMMKQQNMSDLAADAAREAIKLLKAAKLASEDKKTILPVIVHVFSGAGCLVLEQLERLLIDARDAKEPKSGNQEDLMILYEAIQRGGQLFDSCPKYFTVEAGIQAIGTAVPNRTAAIIIQIIYMIVTVIRMIIGKLSGQRPIPEVHWEFILNSDVATRQGYVYSTADRLTDYKRVEEVIEYRKKKKTTPASKVMVQKFVKSKHCAHLMSHPKEYNAFLDEFLASIKEQETEEKLLDEDPDMTDYQLGMD